MSTLALLALVLEGLFWLLWTGLSLYGLVTFVREILQDRRNRK